jgi:hypothetical protein
MPRLWITLRVTHQPLGQPSGLPTYPRASRTTKAFSLATPITKFGLDKIRKLANFSIKSMSAIITLTEF